LEPWMFPDFYLLCPGLDTPPPCLLPLLGDPCLLWTLRESETLGTTALLCADPERLTPMVQSWVAAGSHERAARNARHSASPLFSLGALSDEF
jgi:hypothetical protein